MKNSFLRFWKKLTASGEKIEEFDLVEIIKIPKGQKGIVDIGDVGRFSINIMIQILRLNAANRKVHINGYAGKYSLLKVEEQRSI